MVWYRFLIAGISRLLLLLAPRKQLPPLRLFFRWCWLILLAVATARLLGNFVFFSTSLQYLNTTASQVIGQLWPVVAMMLTNIVILKERMRITQLIEASC